MGYLSQGNRNSNFSNSLDLYNDIFMYDRSSVRSRGESLVLAIFSIYILGKILSTTSI